MKNDDTLRVGLAQIAPVWVNREKTLAKVADYILAAANKGAQLVCFGEALVPGYPFWVELTDGARFESARQKTLYSHYLDQAVSVPRGDLNPICALCREHAIAVYLGIIERADDRSSHSVHASLVYIDYAGQIGSVHRKLVPTYEERLVWAPGDGHGLRTHHIGAFTTGGLNCWENWMPLSRAALYAQGEDLHVAVWPGNVRNTAEITRFIAKESRSYVLSVCGLMRPEDVCDDMPLAEEIKALLPDYAADGGSMLAGPDGEVILEPACFSETLLISDINHARVREERQNFDPTGHYSRPDVTRLVVDRKRQNVAQFSDDD